MKGYLKKRIDTHLNNLMAIESKPIQISDISTVLKIPQGSVRSTLDEIISEYDSIFINFLNILTTFQVKLLRAIASEKWVENITSGAFITTYVLGAASSVGTAIESLLDKELIIKVNNKYRVNYIFFAYWLIRGKF